MKLADQCDIGILELPGLVRCKEPAVAYSLESRHTISEPFGAEPRPFAFCFRCAKHLQRFGGTSMWVPP